MYFYFGTVPANGKATILWHHRLSHSRYNECSRTCKVAAQKDHLYLLWRGLWYTEQNRQSQVEVLLHVTGDSTISKTVILLCVCNVIVNGDWHFTDCGWAGPHKQGAFYHSHLIHYLHPTQEAPAPIAQPPDISKHLPMILEATKHNAQ